MPVRPFMSRTFLDLFLGVGFSVRGMLKSYSRLTAEWRLFGLNLADSYSSGPASREPTALLSARQAEIAASRSVNAEALGDFIYPASKRAASFSTRQRKGGTVFDIWTE